MTTTYTSRYRFPLPAFTADPWHEDMWDALRRIDSVIYETLQVAGLVGAWANATAYTQGQRVFDSTTDIVWTCLVSHTSAASPTTFSADRLAHPTYWVQSALTLTPRGEWVNSCAYAYYDLAYDSTEGVLALCTTAHTSNSMGDIRDDAANWAFIFDFSQSVSADDIGYDDTDTSLGVTVQEAIDELYSSTVTALAAKAPLASPTFTGNPAAPTQSASDNSTRLATTAFVQGLITTLKGGVSSAYDTLAEIATAIGLLAPIASPVLTGTPSAPTAAEGTNTTQIATTAFVYQALTETTLTDDTTIAVDFDSGAKRLHKVTLGGNRTLGNPSNPVVGQTGRIRLIQDATGSRTLAFGTNWEFVNGQAPVLTTTASHEDVLYYDVISSTRILAWLARDPS